MEEIQEIQEVYLSLESRDSIPDNRLILVWALPYGDQRDKTYQVRHFQHQYKAVGKLAELLSKEDDDFLNRLAEADKRQTEETPNRKRWVSVDRSKLTGHKVHEIDGFHLELKHSKIQQGEFARLMCEAAEVDFSTERHPRI